MKKKSKIAVWIIIIALILIGIIIYALFFTNAVSYFGFANPNYSPSDKVGDIAGQASGNAWKEANLNPFSNST